MKIKKILSLICSASMITASLFSCHAEKNDIKVVFAGDEGVGKTQIVNSIKGEDFNNDYETTVGADHLYKEYSEYNDLRFDILDTSGNTFYHQVIKFFKECDIGVICIDLQYSDTINSIDRWLNIIRKDAPSADVVLVGNKVDMKEDRITVNQNISKLKQKAKEFGISESNVILVSAKTSEGIENLENRITYIAQNVIWQREIENQEELDIQNKLYKREKIIKWSAGTSLIAGAILGSSWIYKKIASNKFDKVKSIA